MLRNCLLVMALIAALPRSAWCDTAVVARTFGVLRSSSSSGNLGYYATGDDFPAYGGRSFFTFDLSQVSEPITGGTLRLFNPQYGYSSPNLSETLELFDVSTSVTQLEAAVGGPDVYTDLGSGTAYGSRLLTAGDSRQYVDIPLTAEAISALNAADGLFALGASLPDPATGTVFASSYQDRGVAALLLAGPTAYGTDLHSTQQHPQASHLSFEFFFGDPRGEGVKIAELSQVELAGTQFADINLDAAGNGTLRFAGGRLVLDDSTDVLVNAGPLGTARLSTEGLGLSIRTDTIPVTNFAFSLDDALNPEIYLNTGLFKLTDPTGPLLNLFPNEFPAIADFDRFSNKFQPSDLYGTGMGGTVDLGAGHFSQRGEINLSVPGSIIDLSIVAGDLPIFMRVSGELHVATVPEPSSLLLMAGGIASVAIYVARRRRYAG